MVVEVNRCGKELCKEVLLVSHYIQSWGLRYVIYIVLTNVKSMPNLLQSSSVCTAPNKQEC